MAQDLSTNYETEILDECQEAIGYRFRQPELLRAALTHSSGANTRLAQIGWRTERSIAADGDTQQARDLRDPVHVAELGCFLASPDAAGISGQTFQVHGGTIEHVGTWRVERTWQRNDRGFTADELATELPRDAPAKRADKPPPEWSAARKNR